MVTLIMAAKQELEEPVELPPMTLKPGGSTPAAQWVNGEKILSAPGYPTLVLILADAFANWVQTIALDFTAHHATIRFQIDGIWRDMPPMDRQTGDYMLVVLKQLADLDFRERDERQDGSFTAELFLKKYKCKVRCQPVPTGERVAINIELPRPSPEDLATMGMRPKAVEMVRSFFRRKTGLIISATLPGDGASTLWMGVKAAGDRFISDYVTLEPKGQQEPDVINVNSIEYEPQQGFKAALDKLMLREPDAVFVPNVRELGMLQSMLASNKRYERLLVAQIHARSALDAVYRLLVMGLTPQEISDALIGVVNKRLVRRLCDNCKQSYQPDPATLARLGIAVGRVREFFAPFDPVMFAETDSKGQTVLPPPCDFCQGVGYFGRLGLFEVLENNDDLKQVLHGGKTLNESQEFLHSRGLRSFREEGIAAIALGQTSIEEVQRVLKS